mmetsp:Transcript_100214/g.173125  ORF Transcript_100214/g.173125 Transcript_100214/m.173125 type:complete len:246 (-) Transcript_100214:702-1439(-)
MAANTVMEWPSLFRGTAMKESGTMTSSTARALSLSSTVQLTLVIGRRITSTATVRPSLPVGTGTMVSGSTMRWRVKEPFTTPVVTLTTVSGGEARYLAMEYGCRSMGSPSTQVNGRRGSGTAKEPSQRVAKLSTWNTNLATVLMTHIWRSKKRRKQHPQLRARSGSRASPNKDSNRCPPMSKVMKMTRILPVQMPRPIVKVNQCSQRRRRRRRRTKICIHTPRICRHKPISWTKPTPCRPLRLST